MDSILQKFKSKFIDEAHSLLDSLEKDLLDLEKTPDNKELVESTFRAMHTIKGVSGMYGFEYISDYTHHMESIYQNIRERKMIFTKEVFDVSFSSIDHLRKLLIDEKLENDQTKKIHDVLLEKIQLLLYKDNIQGVDVQPTKSISIEGRYSSTFNILLNSNEHLYFRGISLTTIFKELAGLGEFHIEKVPTMCDDDSEMWSIFLSTDATLDEVQEVLMFIEDDCLIKRVGSRDIFNATTNKSEPKEKTINMAVQQISELPDERKKITSNDDNIQANHADEQVSAIQIGKQESKRISVDSAKLDQLMFLVSELITVNSQLMQDILDPRYEPIKVKIEKIDDLSKLFRNNAIEIRLVPLSDTILRFQRLIRDLSKHLGKKVELITQGIETELDKNTVDQLAEPLMHIIRNCIDHGIENPEQRKKNRKPEVGMIKISAYQSGNFVNITVEDDGIGIDTEKIRNKAIEKGFINKTDKLAKNEIFDLIFLPGFSTAQSLTEVSGRGVGMDVVRKRITDLRGEVIVDSKLGVGSTFTLKIQQSISILDSLLFKVENHYFTIPVSDVDLCDQVDIHEISEKQHTSTLNFNNELITYIDLRRAFGIAGTYTSKTKEIIVKNNHKTFAILADTIIGEHQAVLKPMGKAFNDQPYITAASQLGDGHIAFMLDSNAISKNISKLI
jgi:two-component system chemotaxis sensor kinase CheA